MSIVAATEHSTVGITVWLLSGLTGLDSVVSVHRNDKIFSCLVKFNPVKLDTRFTEINPPAAFSGFSRTGSQEGACLDSQHKRF